MSTFFLGGALENLKICTPPPPPLDRQGGGGGPSFPKKLKITCFYMVFSPGGGGPGPQGRTIALGEDEWRELARRFEQVDYPCSEVVNPPPLSHMVHPQAYCICFVVGITSCTQPTVPTNGSITLDTPEYDLYTRIAYACDDGYTLGGPSEAVCESGGVHCTHLRR